MNSSGFSIIRWQSSGNSVTLRNDFTTGGPIVRLGTKCPSMMSTWMILPPPSPAARTCSPSRAKSAERIDGASSIKCELSEPDFSELSQENSLVEILTCVNRVPGAESRVATRIRLVLGGNHFFGRLGRVFLHLLHVLLHAILPLAQVFTHDGHRRLRTLLHDRGQLLQNFLADRRGVERIHRRDVALREMLLIRRNHRLRHLVNGHTFDPVIHRL